jgi:sugar fermentation stimulation protein A
MLLGPLIQTDFLGRRKRFLADVHLNGKTFTAHLANTGSMKSLLGAESKAFLSMSQNPHRQLPYSLEILKLSSGALACVNTARANAIVHEALLQGRIESIPKEVTIIPESVIPPHSRLDFKIIFPDQSITWIEVKNITLRAEETPTALFPDAVSDRALKHLEVLTALKKQGDRACILYLVNRTDVNEFDIAKAIDPVYASGVEKAKSSGVEFLIYQTAIFEINDNWNIEIARQLPWKR